MTFQPALYESPQWAQPKQINDAIRTALGHLFRHLYLDTVTVRFFRDEPETAEYGGITLGNDALDRVVWLKSGMSVADTVSVLCHEAFHLEEFAKKLAWGDEYELPSEPESEQAAEEFAAKFAPLIRSRVSQYETKGYPWEVSRDAVLLAGGLDR